MHTAPTSNRPLLCRLSFRAMLLTALAVGCDGSSTPPDSELTCEANCDRQANAGCPTTPVDCATSCKLLCASSRSTYPNCVSQLNALSACVASKISFSCDANGVLAVTPVGGCGPSGAACLTCTGDFLACAD